MYKTIIRKQIYEKRCNLTREFVEKNSRKVSYNLFETDILKYKNFLVYSDFKNEVQTGDIIKTLLLNEKNVFLPVCDISSNTFTVQQIFEEDFNSRINFYGIKEPMLNDKTNHKMDCAIIPGIAFDNLGNRIGFGKGYYDKYLSQNKNICKIALCYEFQIVNEISAQKHDLPMNLIVTENRVIKL